MTLIIILFTVGLLLLFFEVIIPGGILGIIGGILLFIGCVLSFLNLGTGHGLIAISITAIAAISVFYIQFKILPNTRIGKHYFLNAQISTTSSTLQNQFPDLIGKTATAMTILSPSGYVSINGKQYEAVSQSGHIPQNTQLEVISATPFQLTVKIKN